MIVLLGESASGKSTLLKMFVRANPKYHGVVTYTTRPKRKGEKNGIDYNFITQAMFDEFVKRDFFAEHNEYRGWSYGTAKADCEDDNAVVILTPAGLRELKKLNYDITSIYLSVDRRSRLINILARGDDVDEAYRRNLSDIGQFDGIENEVDHVIENAGFHMNEAQVLRVLEVILGISDELIEGQISVFDMENNE